MGVHQGRAKSLCQPAAVWRSCAQAPHTRVLRVAGLLFVLWARHVPAFKRACVTHQDNTHVPVCLGWLFTHLRSLLVWVGTGHHWYTLFYLLAAAAWPSVILGRANNGHPALQEWFWTKESQGFLWEPSLTPLSWP